jgi:tetratricopeptide (TPR) repeat protein
MDDESVSLHEASVTLSKTIDDEGLEMNALGNLSNTLSRRGTSNLDHIDLNNSESILKRLLSYSSKINDDNMKSKCLVNLGNLYQAYPDRPASSYKALPCFEEAYSISKTIGDVYGIMQAMTGIGSVYQGIYSDSFDVKTLDLSLSFYRETLEIARSNLDVRMILDCHGNMANVHFYAGRFSDSVKINETALQFARTLSEPPILATTLRNLALAYAQNEQFDRAIETAEEALPLLEVFDRLRADFLRLSAEAWRARIGQGRPRTTADEEPPIST